MRSHFLSASGRSATGNSHHVSHSGCSESTRTVGTSAISSSSERLCSSRVKWRISLPFATSVNVLYITRVCQFRYGEPLDVASTWIPPEPEPDAASDNASTSDASDDALAPSYLGWFPWSS